MNLLVVPLAVQEMVMALWLIVKGFCDVTEHDPALEAPDQRAASRSGSARGTEARIDVVAMELASDDGLPAT
jgi:hypothetical protein